MECTHDSQTRYGPMPQLRSPTHRHEWSPSQPPSTKPAQGVRKGRRPGTETPLHRRPTRVPSISLRRTRQGARHSTSLWWRSPILASWLDQTNPKREAMRLPANPDTILEACAMESYVQNPWNQRWRWTGRCRRPRPIVAFVIGSRSNALWRTRWETILRRPRAPHLPCLPRRRSTMHQAPAELAW